MVPVFVVSAMPAVRAGLRSLLERSGTCQVIGEADHLVAATDEMFQSLPAVVVVDAGGLELREVLSSEPDRGVPLVVLGPIPGDELLADELGGRAWGYVPRDTSGEQLVAAVHAVANGLTTIDLRVGAHLLSGGLRSSAGSADLEAGTELTAREEEVLQLVAHGLANKMIARRLGISEHTVKFHVAAILAKLGASSRTEAVHIGARRGLVAL